jgi:hypothetical protein
MHTVILEHVRARSIVVKQCDRIRAVTFRTLCTDSDEGNSQSTCEARAEPLTTCTDGETRMLS